MMIAEQIEKEFAMLPHEAQLTLLDRLILRAGQKPRVEEPGFADEMAAMASDLDVQREVRAANETFRCAEADGLSSS